MSSRERKGDRRHPWWMPVFMSNCNVGFLPWTMWHAIRYTYTEQGSEYAMILTMIVAWVNFKVFQKQIWSLWNVVYWGSCSHIQMITIISSYTLKIIYAYQVTCLSYEKRRRCIEIVLPLLHWDINILKKKILIVIIIFIVMLIFEYYSKMVVRVLTNNALTFVHCFSKLKLLFWQWYTQNPFDGVYK